MYSERTELAQKDFCQSGLDHLIELILGNALEVMPQVYGSFDLVFLDALKSEYTNVIGTSSPLAEC